MPESLSYSLLPDILGTAMARPNKGERKQRVQEWAAAERAALVASMPLSSAQLDSLLDYLDANLRECDRTNRLTQIFLHAEQLDRDRVLSWLAEQGGYCDCEVLLNLRDLADSFHKKPAPPQPQPKARRPPRDLDTRTGWDLARLPR